jgi:hypothetical protein
LWTPDEKDEPSPSVAAPSLVVAALQSEQHNPFLFRASSVYFSLTFSITSSGTDVAFKKQKLMYDNCLKTRIENLYKISLEIGIEISILKFMKFIGAI